MKLDFDYLVEGNSPASRLALKTAAQIGVTALGVFTLAHKERFDGIGLANIINSLRKGL